MGEILDRRALNRATLQRQFLLRRVNKPVVDVLHQVVGMQAQLPNPPYFGLWARLTGFAPAMLSDLVTRREVVRLSLMRGTIHLVTVQDCLMVRPLLQGMHVRSLGGWSKALGDVDIAAVTAAGRELVERQPLTFALLGAALAQRFPGSDAQALAMVVRMCVPLVQVPPRGLWGESGQAAHTSAEAWLGSPLRADSTVDELFLRYLAGFGPAGVKDAQVWSGLTRLREVAERLRPKLRTFRDDNGVELFDLPEAARPGPDVVAPVRFIAEWDNMLLSYADRSRIIADEHRKHIFTVNGVMPGPYLVDGMVAGTWKVVSGKDRSTLRIRPFGKTSTKDVDALHAEGAQLLKFAAPGASHDIELG